MFRTLTDPVELSFISIEEVMAWYCALTSCTMLDESAERVPLITEWEIQLILDLDLDLNLSTPGFFYKGWLIRDD